MEKIIFFGAGAIGRGYMPWVFEDGRYDFVFVDTNKEIVRLLREKKQYVTYRVRNGELESRVVPVSAAFLPGELSAGDLSGAVACFFSVGPRNVARAAGIFRGTDIPLILCENEPNTVNEVKGVVGHDRVYFAVPDVITSNTAPAHLLALDPLSVVSEDGVLFIEEGPTGVEGDFRFIPASDLLDIQWTAKLFLHNTPHCVAAYLGAMVGATYVHEAMAVPEVNAVVAGTMHEMLRSLKVKWNIPHDFLEWYADKELARFRCEKLFDPVSRVAREPLRKLEVHGRLIGAAQICLHLGIVPANILIGITGALLFDNENDPDHHLVFLRQNLPKDLFNSFILGLRVGEPLELLLREQIDEIITSLNDFPKIGNA